MSITVAMREGRREKEPTVCARMARIQHNLVLRCRSEFIGSSFWRRFWLPGRLRSHFLLLLARQDA